MDTDSISLSEKLKANLTQAVDALDQLTYTDVEAHRKALAATKGGLLAEIAQLKAAAAAGDVPEEESDEEDTKNNLTKREWDAEMEKVRLGRLKLEEDMVPFTILGAQVAKQLQWGRGVKRELIAARELNIVFGERPECWKWTSVPETSYAVAELLGVDLLDISARIKTSKLSPGVEYTTYLVFKLNEEVDPVLSSLPPFEAYVGVVGGEKNVTKVSLVHKPFPTSFEETDEADSVEPDQYAEARFDGWTGVELGDYLVKEDEEVELQIGLKEISGNSLKKGLIIMGIEIKCRWD